MGLGGLFSGVCEGSEGIARLPQGVRGFILCFARFYRWMVVEIVVSFWVPIIIRHLLFRVPQKGTIILTTTQVGFSVRDLGAPL